MISPLVCMQDRGFRGKNHNLQKYNGPALIQGGPTLSDSVSLSERELRKRVSLERRDEPKLPTRDEKFLQSQAPMFPCLPTCNFGSHAWKQDSSRINNGKMCCTTRLLGNGVFSAFASSRNLPIIYRIKGAENSTPTSAAVFPCRTSPLKMFSSAREPSLHCAHELPCAALFA